MIANHIHDALAQVRRLQEFILEKRLFKGYYQEVFSHIKRKAPNIRILFHICGAMRGFIPMLIEIGADAINPVEVGAKGMGDTRPFTTSRSKACWRRCKCNLVG